MRACTATIIEMQYNSVAEIGGAYRCVRSAMALVLFQYLPFDIPTRIRAFLDLAFTEGGGICRRLNS